MEEKLECVDLTRKFCTKFSGILLVDGKYISVRGYERKIPVIYGIDYLTHDIPHYVLSISENYQTLKNFFASLRLAGYPLQAIVSDDNINIPEACRFNYPKAVTQLCHNHFKQSLREFLGLPRNETYRVFMGEVEVLFSRKMSKEEFKLRASKLYFKHKDDEVTRKVMLTIARRSGELMAYTGLPHVPRTSNLIECFNSHLEGRLKTIKGFKSFESADLWLNSYFIRRRLKPFTDCTKKFKHLNNKRSLEITLNNSYKIENVLKLIR